MASEIIKLTTQDKIDNYRTALKESDNKKLQKLNKQDIKELLQIERELYSQFLVDAPHMGFNAIDMGFGTLRWTHRKPVYYVDLDTGEKKLSRHTPMYYFRVKEPLRLEAIDSLNEAIEKEEEELRELRGDYE